MGPLTPVSAHARPSAQAPIDTSGIFLAQVSGRGGGSKNVKDFPINFLAISGDSKHFSFFPEKKPGGQGLKTSCKIWEPYDNSFWEKSNPAEEREIEERKERKNAVNSGHLVL